jgi:transcriptional regulator of acetoin/glycerol metabolism
MLLTNADGVVLDAVGDAQTLEQGQYIHLTQGGDWREDVVGTNGIGTALATGRPAQVHAAEHFCEGIKHWTCAASPIHDPGTGLIIGVVDISGPPSTYQRNNLTLAVTTARQIETALGERVARERMRLLEVCLHRISGRDAAGLIALDRNGRLVHATGRIPDSIGIGERLPGLDRGLAMEDWADHLPEGWRPEWLNLVSLAGSPVGAVLVIPDKARPAASRPPPRGSESDPARSSFAHLVGRGAAMTALIDQARRLVGRQVPVLIEGETGVGKELVARAIHDDAQGRRPFIAFNCGAVSRELVAGELFGHIRGAYTGATTEGRPGRFELAHQGTLCLDEIGEMPLDLQPVLLRVLEEGVVYRLGDAQPRRVDVRLIAITNRNLREEVAAGRFRRDLFYRISVTALTVPPLRDRIEDLDALIDHFNRTLATRHHVPMRQFTPEVLDLLRAQSWPGNVRELRNLVERLLLTTSDQRITPDDLPPELTGRVASSPAAQAAVDGPAAISLEEVERGAILRALDHEGGNLAGVARRLGISRSTLYRKICRHGLTPSGPR